MPKLQAYRESTPDLCKSFVSWALEDDLRTLDRGDYETYETCYRAWKRWQESRRGARQYHAEMQSWTSEACQDRQMTASEVRARLLELQSGTHEVNGVPVRRVPCDGAWFEVGVCEDGNGMTRKWQMLRLADAVSRCMSGYFPRLHPMLSEREWRQSADDLHREQGWTVPWEDSPEQRRSDAIRHACLVDGEDPAWANALHKWLGRPMPPPPSLPQTDLLDEWRKIEPGAYAYPVLRYTEACAVALHGKVTQPLQRVPRRPRRLREKPVDQLALW